MKAVVKVLMIAEMEVEGEDLEAAAQAKLDEFREAVLPELNFGIMLYRADSKNAIEEMK